MKLTIDTELKTLIVEEGAVAGPLPLYSPEAFELLSELWVKVGWAQRYSYTFTWLGRPVIQMPEDMVRIQELIYTLKPDLIIETGIAHGGSLVFYASLLELIGRGRVLGVDIEIRPHNREAIETHPLFSRIDIIERSSTAPETIAEVGSYMSADEVVMVVLDSNHTREHVLSELRAYSGLVSVGSYIVVADGIMQILDDVPGGQADWSEDNPLQAALDFTRENPDFLLEEPDYLFSESSLSNRVTYWPRGFIRRLR